MSATIKNQTTSTTTQIDFLDRRRAADEQQRESAQRIYRELIPKLSSGVLSKADEAKLGKALDDLRKDLGEVEADVRAVQRAAQLADTAAGLDDAEAEAEAEALAAIAYEAEAVETLRQVEAERHRRLTAHSAAVDRRQAVRAAKAELGRLQREFNHLFGGQTAAEHARKLHLVQTAYGRPANTEFDVREFEQIMTDPRLFQNDKDYVPVAGQSPEELADLIQRAKALHADHASKTIAVGRYLSPVADEPRFANRSTVIWCDAGDVDRTLDHAVDPSTIRWERLPGQPGEELAKLVTAFTRRVKDAREKRWSRRY